MVSQFVGSSSASGSVLSAQSVLGILPPSLLFPPLKINNKIKLKKKRITYLGINLTKEVNDLDSESYKVWMKEIENYTNKGKDILCLEESILLKYHTAQINIQNYCNSYKNTTVYFTEIKQIIYNLYRTTQDPE